MNNLPSIVKVEDSELKTFALSIKDSYTYEIKHYVNYLNQNNMKFNFESFKTYIEVMKREGTPVRTINKRIFGIKKRIRTIFEINVGNLDIVRKYHLDRCLKEIKTLKVADVYIDDEKKITQDEFHKLMASEEIPEDIKLIISFLFRTGVRISEALNIRLKNIKEYQNCVKIRIIGKGGKEYLKRLPDLKFYNELREYFKGKEFLFEREDGSQYERHQVTMMIKRHSKKILGREISSHTMRHSFATIMIEKTGKIKATSEELAHSSAATTMDMYTHERLSLEELNFV